MIKNCKICSCFYCEEVGDSDYGAIYAEEPSCSQEKDLEEFNRDIERDCCDIDFWKVLELDKEIKDLFMLCEEKDLWKSKAFERFKEKYSV